MQLTDLTSYLQICENLSDKICYLNEKVTNDIAFEISPKFYTFEMIKSHNERLNIQSDLSNLPTEILNFIAHYLTYDEILFAKRVSRTWNYCFEKLPPQKGMISLPFDLQLLIAKQLNLKEIANAKQVCSRWNFALSNPSILSEFTRSKNLRLYKECNLNQVSPKTVSERIILTRKSNKLLAENAKIMIKNNMKILIFRNFLLDQEVDRVQTACFGVITAIYSFMIGFLFSKSL